jgi:hypothetical protein
VNHSMKPLATTFAALALLGTTAGCASLGLGKSGPGPATCGADMLDTMLGSAPTPEARAYIAARVGDRPIRYYTRGDPITMDYNPDRLNVVLGPDGRIAEFRCG